MSSHTLWCACLPGTLLDYPKLVCLPACLSVLQAVRSQLGEQELQRVISETVELKERQETPDPPEAAACIPRLHLSGGVLAPICSPWTDARVPAAGT